VQEKFRSLVARCSIQKTFSRNAFFEGCQTKITELKMSVVGDKHVFQLYVPEANKKRSKYSIFTLWLQDKIFRNICCAILNTVFYL